LRVKSFKQVKNDVTVFIVSFSQLKANDRVIWTNNTSNSVQTCRTVKFEFVKETDSYVKNLYDLLVERGYTGIYVIIELDSIRTLTELYYNTRIIRYKNTTRRREQK